MKNEEVSAHVLSLGLSVLKHGVYHAHIQSPDNDKWDELSVVQVAHAAELIIKARIAREHPLLIFEQLPKLAPGEQISLEKLAGEGRTYQYNALPNRLLATTGVAISDLTLFKEFGQLRNSIQHFCHPPGVDLRNRTLAYIFGIIDPLLGEGWEQYAIDHNEDYEPYQYLVQSLVSAEITFRPSPQCLPNVDLEILDWPDSASYKQQVHSAFTALRQSQSS
jgi:hypothetical protein